MHFHLEMDNKSIQVLVYENTYFQVPSISKVGENKINIPKSQIFFSLILITSLFCCQLSKEYFLRNR